MARVMAHEIIDDSLLLILITEDKVEITSECFANSEIYDRVSNMKNDKYIIQSSAGRNVILTKGDEFYKIIEKYQRKENADKKNLRV